MDREWVNELVRFAHIHDHAPQLGQENPRREAAAAAVEQEGTARGEPVVEREVQTPDVFAEEEEEDNEEDDPGLQYPPDEEEDDGNLYGHIFASDPQLSAAAGAPDGIDTQPSYAAPLLNPVAGDGSEVAVAARSVMGTGKWVVEDEPETSAAAAADRKGKAKVVVFDDEDDENERAIRKKLKTLEAAAEAAERKGKGIVIRDQDLEVNDPAKKYCRPR